MLESRESSAYPDGSFVALVITAIFYQITKGRRTVQTEVPTRELVVAKENLPIGSVITEEDVRVIDFPEQAYPKEAFGSIEDVTDRSVINPVLANEPILAGRVTEKGAGVGLAPLIPEDERAIAVPISQVTGVSGFINPGSEVDILLTGSPGKSGDRVTTTILENVVVLFFFDDPDGKIMLVGCIILQFLGFVTIRKIVNIGV